MRLKPCLFALLFAFGCLTAFANPPAAIAQNDHERYSVQFRLPLDKNEVWNFVEMISGLGYPSYMYTEESTGSSTYYYAQMGSYPSIVDAIDAASALNKKVSVEYDVVHTNTNTIVKLGSNSGKPASAAKAPQAQQPDAQPTQSSKGAGDYDEPIVTAPAAPAVAAPKTPALPETPQQPDTPALAAKAAAPEAAPAQTQAEEDKVYLLQIFSFQVPNNAVQTAKNYKRKGYDPKIIRLYDSQDNEWFVVTVGHANTQEKAAFLAERFAEKEGKRPTLNNVDANFLKTRIVPFE